MQKLTSIYPLLVLCLLAACGGSGGGMGGEIEDTTPEVNSTTPVDGATDIPRNQVISVSFDEGILNTSINETTLILEDSFGKLLSGTVTFEGLTDTASFSADNEFALLSTYTATATRGVADLAGNFLESDSSWQFTIRDGNWGDPELIETDDIGNARQPRISDDGHGNAIAIWRQEKADGSSAIYSNRHDAESSWNGRELVGDENAIGFVRGPRISLAPDGSAIAVWTQSNLIDDLPYSIWSNHYDPNTGWGDAELIETDDRGIAFEPVLDIDTNGNAIAAWAQSDGTNMTTMTNLYTPETGWGDPEPLGNNAGSLSVDFDNSGNALAVWTQIGALGDEVWGNLYTQELGWGTAEQIGHLGGGDARQVSINFNLNGEALAIWRQAEDEVYDLWTNLYSPEIGWGSPSLFEQDPGEAAGGSIRFDDSGNGMGYWIQSDGNYFNFWSIPYSTDSGWGTAELIENNDTGDAVSGYLDFDANGNAVAVWIQVDDSHPDNIWNAWSNRYTPEAGWGSAQLIESNDTGDAFDARIVRAANGNAIAVWTQSNQGRLDIYSNIFD